MVAADVAALTDTGMVTVCGADLADAGMAFPADLAGVVAADVTTLTDAWMVTVGVADLADAGKAFPANLAGLTTMGVTEVTDVVCSPESGSDVVMWDDHMSPGAWCHAGARSRCDVDCQYMGCVGCDPVSVDCAGPAAGCSGSQGTCPSDDSVPVTDYMTCWEKLEAMSEARYDSFEGADYQPRYFDYDPRDYEEWCA